jgi:integrase
MRVNLKWVLRDKDRHGNVRYYFRQDRTKPMVRLRGEPGSPEFVKSYNAAQDGSVPERKVAHRLSEDSLEWLCRRYYESTEFGQLDASTQRRRRQILTEVCIKHGDKPFAMLEEKHIRALRNEKAATPEAANQRVKALKQLFRIAKEDGLVDKNPTLEVRKLKSSGVGWHCWTDAEVEQFEMRHPIGTKAHLALGLLLYTAQRRSDVVLMGRRHIRNGWMTLTQQKNRKRNPVEVSIPVIPELQKVIEMSPTGELTFLVTDYGRPFSVAGFGNWFRDRCNEAGLPHCSAHGLRKAAATRLAENGCTAKEIMAITGHKTLAEVQRYIEAAERKRLAAAAMAKLRSN